MAETYLKKPNKTSLYLIMLFSTSFCCIQAKTIDLIRNYLDFETSLFNDDILFCPPQSEIKSLPSYICKNQGTKQSNKKKWTVIVYIAADNDLRVFAANNIKQMASLGSNENVNIVVHLDIRITGNKKITRRYYVENNKITHVNADDPLTQRMDSGNPKTLVSCCKWAIENYPAHNYMLVLWNHGTGIIDPRPRRIINPAELFTFNSTIHKLELDRSVGFLDLIGNTTSEQRGICWDDTTGNYLSNQKLDSALKEICSTLLQENKFSIIGFDACLMSMLEVAHVIKKYTHIMVGSQEVELGTGWNYAKALAPLHKSSVDKKDIAQHIVDVFEKTYAPITNDFTQSAIDLDQINLLEQNIHTVGSLLSQCLKNQKNNSVKNAIRSSRAKQYCTHFDEPSYLDLHHLYHNIQTHIKNFVLSNEQDLKTKLNQALDEGKKLIKQAVIANTTGKNLRNAHGISIYFPERILHSSYTQSQFASTNAWAHFVGNYLQV